MLETQAWDSLALVIQENSMQVLADTFIGVWLLSCGCSEAHRGTSHAWLQGRSKRMAFLL